MTVGKQARSRAWCFTVNNWTTEELEELKKIECSYIVLGDEIGKSGTNHIQGYVEFENAKTLVRCKKYAGLRRAHLEARRGTPTEASDYCKMDGKILFESGSLSNQGKRTDLDQLAKEILEGETNEDTIVVNDPMTYHQYGRTINKLQDLALRKKWRTKMTEGLWIFGETGTGKSQQAYKDYHPDTHYNLPNDNGWWDGYTGQKIVIINEFRGEIKYSELLELLDWTPKTVKRRGREPVPLLAEQIIITSSLSPEEVYSNLALNDSLGQLLRRIKIVELKEIKSKPTV
jgi:hypothetical protein